MYALHQFGAIEHLAMPLLFQQIDNVLGILRAVWIETFAIQQFERIEHSSSLSRTVLPGNGTQRILRRLVSVGTSNEHREGRIIRCLILKVRSQTYAGNGIHQIAKVNALVWCKAREGTDVLAFCPLSEGFRLALMCHLESRGHVLLQPQHQLPQEARRLRLKGSFGVSRSSGGKVKGRSIVFECGTQAIICTTQAQKDLIGLLFVFEGRRVERLDEVEVKIALWH